MKLQNRRNIGAAGREGKKKKSKLKVLAIYNKIALNSNVKSSKKEPFFVSKKNNVFFLLPPPL